MQNEGSSYRLSSSCISTPHTTLDLLDEVFRLPAADEVLRVRQPESRHLAIPLPVANLDGLLAACFTRPDVVRCCSVAALLLKQVYDPTVIGRAISSAEGICRGWKKKTAQVVAPAPGWLGALLKDYDSLQPCQPLPTAKISGIGITATLALDPSLGYASRQPLSDGRVVSKVNMTIHGTRFATLLAYIGAMRFLRAQPVAGDLIVYSVPIAGKLTLRAESSRRLLWPRYDDEPEQALLLQALDLVSSSAQDESGWDLLPYQVLQAQSKQQAISRARGTVNLAWLGRLHQRVGAQLLDSWQWLLQKAPEAHPYELDHLIEALINCRRSEWENHLLEVARVELLHKPSQASNGRKNRLRLYSLHEVQEVSGMMESAVPTPLSTILARREGTMRFGHALRQLRQLDSSPAHEILDDLEAVSTCDQLMDVLTRAMQTCEVMDAKSPFMIVPSDPDLKLLLEDVERYGAHTVAELLRLLSTLRYAPRRKEADQLEDTQSHGESSTPGVPDEADESA
jgi:hypothetical protein